jgi:hypothetical protein
MNGRIYEPLVARFMSSDPIVQDPFSTQSLNRYSYVMNNPMAHTDPTGFQAEYGTSFGFSFGYGSAWDYGYGYTTYYSPVWNLMLYQPETQPSQPVYSKGTASSGRGTGAGDNSVFGDIVGVINKYADAVKMTPAEFAWEMTAGAGLYKSGFDAAERGGIGNNLLAGIYYVAGAAEQGVAYSGFVLGPHTGAATMGMVGGIKITAKMALRVGGKIIDDVSSLGVKSADSAATGSTSGLYRVGTYNEIKGTVPGLDAHHVGQKGPTGDMIPGYDPLAAPAILVPKVGHTIRGPNGIVSRSVEGLTTPRSIVARDVMELRRVFPDIPNSQLQELIRMNKAYYPQSFGRPLQ